MVKQQIQGLAFGLGYKGLELVDGFLGFLRALAVGVSLLFRPFYLLGYFGFILVSFFLSAAWAIFTIAFGIKTKEQRAYYKDLKKRGYR